ncbi:hypothetical protein Taro_054789 [Colocasia esculenta]|uniref:Uncharacterized protein n=1 Tax=Colocasia esculenta TaxID=4460 RepID=A0A843XPM2_COLES|nr:hypothetical protein [Colocasia esculenta]
MELVLRRWSAGACAIDGGLGVCAVGGGCVRSWGGGQLVHSWGLCDAKARKWHDGRARARLGGAWLPCVAAEAGSGAADLVRWRVSSEIVGFCSLLKAYGEDNPGCTAEKAYSGKELFFFLVCSGSVWHLHKKWNMEIRLDI